MEFLRIIAGKGEIMGSGYHPRGSTEAPFEGYPAFGAVHELIPDEGIRNFLYDFSRMSNLVLKQSLGGIEVEPISGEQFRNPQLFAEENARLPKGNPEIEAYNPKLYYKIFDVNTMGVSVLEMDPQVKAARNVRALWESQDFGAVSQEARDSVDRSNPGLDHRLEFTGVEGVGKRLPDFEKTEIRRKLALMPDTTKHIETLDMLDDEGEIIYKAIRRRLKQFLAPWDRMTHLTFAAFRQKTKPHEISAIQQSARNYVGEFPLEVRLDHLSFRHRSVRGKRSR